MAMIDVSELIGDPDFSTTFTRVRAGGAYTNGRWIDATPVLTEHIGIIQPATTEDALNFLPEGERAKTLISIWSISEIRMGNGDDIKSDLINWQGRQYRVIQSRPWHLSGYIKALAVETGAA